MASSSSSKGSLLPFDILESILYKVPAESLNRFKSTCKRWLNLFKDKRFFYNHLDLVQEHFIHMSDMVQIINPETNARSSLPLPDEFRDRFNRIMVMHCDGLLLCVTDNSTKLAVWNPFFNQVRWILKPNGSYSCMDTYGFGYDSISRDNYKILRFHNPDWEGEFTDEYDPTFEIYEFKSDSWRTLDAPLDWAVCPPCRGVSVKGNVYWIAESEHMSDNCIQSFDFSTETFKPICLIPFPFDTVNEVDDVVDLAAYREDKLSLLRQRSKPDQSWDIEVWVTNNVKDRVVSWIKLFAVSRPDLPELYPSDSSLYILYFIDKNNRINVMSSEGEEFLSDGSRSVFLNLYIIGKDGFQIKEIGRHRVDETTGYVYLPSLVPVP